MDNIGVGIGGIMKHHKDPGRFNPALRNREVVLEPELTKAWIGEHALENEASDFLTAIMDVVREDVRRAGTALDEGNLAAVRECVASLAALAVAAGARQLEKDCRLIQASLSAGRSERARRLCDRLHCDVTALDEAFCDLVAESTRSVVTGAELVDDIS